MGGSEQRINQVDSGLDGDDDARLEHARQPKMGMTLGTLALVARRIGQYASDVVHLQSEQMADPVREEGARDAERYGLLSGNLDQPQAVHRIAEQAVGRQMAVGVIAAGDNFVAQQPLGLIGGGNQRYIGTGSGRVAARDVD